MQSFPDKAKEETLWWSSNSTSGENITLLPIYYAGFTTFVLIMEL